MFILTLFAAPGACSTAAHIALKEAELAFEIVCVDLSGDPITADGRPFRDINPKGFVPALEIAPRSVLTETTAILQYIADQNPGSGLAPAPSTLERYRLQEWLGFINSDLHRSFTPLFRASTPERTESLHRKKIGHYLDFIDSAFASCQFLMGDSFTVADCYLFTVLSWSASVQVPLSEWPAVSAYHDTVRQRDSVSEVLTWERQVGQAG